MTDTRRMSGAILWQQQQPMEMSCRLIRACRRIPFTLIKKCDKVSKASKTDVRGCKCRKAADEESPGFTGQDAG